MPEKGAGKEKKIILVATRNPGKFQEFKNFFKDLPIELLSLRDFPELKKIDEPYQTFEENARHKAIIYYQQTGLTTLADDSGLEVEALGGAPGVRSARFAGENATDQENNQKLLGLLKGLEREKRKARFVCVLALAVSEKEIEMVRAETQGIILESPRGEKGFGYDPIFYYPPSGKTFAEMEPKEKLKFSHRGKALVKMREIILRRLRENRP